MSKQPAGLTGATGTPRRDSDEFDSAEEAGDGVSLQMQGLTAFKGQAGDSVVDVPVVKHYTGVENPLIKFDCNEWWIEGDREDAEELAESINRLRGQVYAEQQHNLSLNAELDALRQRLANVEFERNGWMNEAGAEKLARLEAENNAKHSHSETIRLRGFLEATRRAKKC